MMNEILQVFVPLLLDCTQWHRSGVLCKCTRICVAKHALVPVSLNQKMLFGMCDKNVFVFIAFMFAFMLSRCLCALQFDSGSLESCVGVLDH